MKRLLGNKVEVFLKLCNDTMSGILFDDDDECIYIQSEVDTLITIPKENIKYYISSSYLDSNVIEKTDRIQEPRQTQQSIIDALSVYIDQVFVVKIPVPPTFNLSTFNDDIMKVTLGNPDVQVALANRTQKSVEYFPGTIHIITHGEPINEPVPLLQDSFSMSSSGGPANTYLNPSQMVGRLNKISKIKPEEIKK